MNNQRFPCVYTIRLLQKATVARLEAPENTENKPLSVHFRVTSMELSAEFHSKGFNTLHFHIPILNLTYIKHIFFRKIRLSHLRSLSSFPKKI